MQELAVSKQTLAEFMEAPFGIKNTQKDLKYLDRYEKYVRENKIKVESTLELDGDYFIHLKVPSESDKKNVTYDVVVQFFTPDDMIRNSMDVTRYYVQFFSNSPGFVYKYAALYKLQGYLIESLYEKFHPGTLEILPDKANKDYELSYDSTIFYACRYLLDKKFLVLGKLNMKTFKQQTPENFFKDIEDIEGITISRDIGKLEAEMARDRGLTDKKKMKLEKKQDGLFQKEIKRLEDFHRKGPVKSTLGKDAISSIKRIVAKQATSQSSSTKRIRSSGKIRSTKSTTKK